MDTSLGCGATHLRDRSQETCCFSLFITDKNKYSRENMVADSTNIVNFKMISVQTFSLRFRCVKSQEQRNKTLIRWLHRPHVNGAGKGLRKV